MGSNEPPFFHKSFDFLLLCYSHQSLSLSKSPRAIHLKRGCSATCSNSAGFGKDGRGHVQFFTCLSSAFVNEPPFLNGWIRRWTGFFCDFQVYTGRMVDDEVEHGLGEKVVLHLSRNIEGHNHQVFCDNFFTTSKLLELLLDRGVYTCGTTRPSR